MRSVTALLCCLLLAGCISAPAPPYQPGIENSKLLRAMPAGKMAVGDFSAEPGVNDHSLSLRGNRMTGGADGTFSNYLEQALQSELRSAGRYNADEAVIVSGSIVRNDISSAGPSVGSAALAVRFLVQREGAEVYDRTLATEHSWKSHFMGAVAVNWAMQGYVATVQKLIGELFADPRFVAAVSE